MGIWLLTTVNFMHLKICQNSFSMRRLCYIHDTRPNRLGNVRGKSFLVNKSRFPKNWFLYSVIKFHVSNDSRMMYCFGLLTQINIRFFVLCWYLIQILGLCMSPWGFVKKSCGSVFHNRFQITAKKSHTFIIRGRDLKACRQKKKSCYLEVNLKVFSKTNFINIRFLSMYFEMFHKNCFISCRNHNKTTHHFKITPLSQMKSCSIGLSSDYRKSSQLSQNLYSNSWICI